MKHYILFLTLLILSLSLQACSDSNLRNGRGLNRGDRPRTPYQIKDHSLGGLDAPELDHLYDVAMERSCLLLNLDGDVLGSACIISKDGLLITCSRVVGLMNHLRAQIGDKIFPVELKAWSTTNGVALLKVRADGSLPYFPLIPGLTLKYDQPVLAASSNPVNGKISAGFISGKHVSQWVGDSQFLFESIIHTAPVFDGDFGGPLLDMHGRLLGIHACAGETTSIAVSVDAILALYDDLQKGGEIAGILPANTKEEAQMVVPGLMAYAVHESGSADYDEVLAELMDNIQKYKELYVFLKQQTDEPTERFLSMVVHDVSRMAPR